MSVSVSIDSIDPKLESLTMQGLSIYQPYGWAIINADPAKDIENRGWYQSYRGWLAIHAASKKITTPYMENFALRFNRAGGNLLQIPRKENFVMKSILGLVRVVACVKQHKSPWFVGDGQWGWVLADRIALPKPIGISGQTGLWPVEPTERIQIFEQVGDQLLAVERRLCEERKLRF